MLGNRPLRWPRAHESLPPYGKSESESESRGGWGEATDACRAVMVADGISGGFVVPCIRRGRHVNQGPEAARRQEEPQSSSVSLKKVTGKIPCERPHCQHLY
ncbi:hypothetical protein AAFF_G00035570 [Aldrovandia affinis]|uniref:Uncharacterized protein n=1 Tax=Aldrovandia affinis TaxID=143900 RepID=A0AAD7S347_9TELE|nr:hypothetical protein AAFF_G00035570 [Aldrovandia affinis]